MIQNTNESQAQLVQHSANLNDDIDFFSNLGFRLDQIYPADNPTTAILSGHAITIRLDKSILSSPGTIHILTDFPEKLVSNGIELIAPNGTICKILPKTYQLKTPPTLHKFEVRQLLNNDPWIIGRAGMHYRDLIPDRLGGSIIASHINIPEGGLVPDMVHYHTIGFQLIYCYKGWVKLVYEDQGPPFILNAGDCVTQPPEIRHRVLESSDNLEVIEVGVPAEHMTTIDHNMELPNGIINPQRKFQGQTFCHHKVIEAAWQTSRLENFEQRNTGIDVSTNGIASVVVCRTVNHRNISQWTSHDCDILFTFVLEGEMELSASGYNNYKLQKRDSFVIPPELKYRISNVSEDLELLEVSLPGKFSTKKYNE